jgi:Xaa-Pro aminopeptidase
MDFPQAEYGDRLRRIRQQMTIDGVDALLINGAHNVRYATGFRGEPRSLVLTQDHAILATSLRCIPWAEAQTSGVELSTKVNANEIVKDCLPNRSTIGVESDVSHERFLQLQQKLCGHELKISRSIEATRMIKSEAEIEIMRRAQRIAEAIFIEALPEIVVGVSERFLRGRILSRIAKNEALDGPSFNPIVAAGENAWEIHHQPDMRPIRDGDLIIVDMGVILHGYCSDMTRTLCLGKPNTEMQRLYTTVHGAQTAAFAQIKPGVAMGDVDAAARACIEKAGYGRFFTHGLGHSVGLAAHDPGPAFKPEAPQLLQAGMAMSVEPGAYLQGKFGVRIEDVIIVREHGYENLMAIDNELITL